MDDREIHGKRHGEAHALRSIGAADDHGDAIIPPEEWRKLRAEWIHDYGLRRLEDRGVKYEDEIERQLDLAAEAAPSPADLRERAGPQAPRLTDGHKRGHKL